MPTFSVIIDNYNYRSYVNQAIKSIINQRFKDYQLIIVDDGSDDGSIDNLISDTEFLLIRTNRLGQARACLEALKQATGRYIYILDADDFASHDLLSTAARLIGETPAKLQFRLVPTDKNGNPFANPFPNLTQEQNAAIQQATIYSHGRPISPPTSGNIFHRSVLEVVGDISYETSIDGVTLLIAPFLGQIVSIPKSLAFYRVHESSQSAHAAPLDGKRIQKNRQRFEDRIKHLNRILAHLRPFRKQVRNAKSFFHYWDCLTLEATLARQPIGTRVVLGYIYTLLCEYRLTIFSLRKLAWLFIAIAAPRSIKLRFMRDRMNPWARRRGRNLGDP